MRVIGGTFTSTDAVNGIVLARNDGANANNVGVGHLHRRREPRPRRSRSASTPR